MESLSGESWGLVQWGLFISDVLMGNLKTEYWEIGAGECYFYTENAKVAKELMKEFPKYATYSRERVVFGWQFRIPKQSGEFWHRRATGKYDK